MLNAHNFAECTDVAAKAAGDVTARQHLLEDAVAGTSMQRLPKHFVPERDPEVAHYIRSQLELWSDRVDEPTFEITKSWTRAKLEGDRKFEQTIKAPSLQKFVRGDNLNVLEIGAQWDVTVPRLLEPQLSQYVAADLHGSPPVERAWTTQLTEFGL